MRRKHLVIAMFALLLLAGCGPEDGRAVGGGAGADIGNHSPSTPKSKLFVPGSGAGDAQP
jgi:hypothetical protein